MVSLSAVAFFSMLFNFIVSVAIVAVNKIVFQTNSFHYSTLLTAVHFAVTFFGLCICAYFQVFTVRLVPIHKVLPLCLAFIGFVLFNNLSLQYNSVSFYQLMKVLTTPAIVVVQYFYYNVRIDTHLALALIPVCVGVGLATVDDMMANTTGTLCAFAGVLSATFYQIFIKSEQIALRLNSYQLLFVQSPVSAVMVFAISLLFEPMTGKAGWLAYEYTTESVTAIIASSVLAFAVNISIFLVIGQTSPIAYNVLGHFKLCVILLSGVFFFYEELSLNKTIGIGLALTGIIAYSSLQNSAKSGWENKKQIDMQRHSKRDVSNNNNSENHLNNNNKND